jgi:Uma2 family endonuclease
MLEAMVEMSIPVEPDQIRRLSRAEYLRMAELGMFEDERVELLHGIVVKMSPIGWSHTRVEAWLLRKLILSLDDSYEVRPQSSWPAGEWSMPEPDIAVARKDYSVRDYPKELLLVIEVADSSIRRDRGPKLSIYAAAGVPEYWIVDVNAGTVDVCTEPTGDRYTRVVVVRDGDMLRPTRLAGVEIAVADIPR